MHKDVRYKVIRHLIEDKRITEFREIFETLPKTIVGHELSKNPSRMGDLIDNPEKFSVKDIHRIGQLIGVDTETILKLILKQYLNTSSNRS